MKNTASTKRIARNTCIALTFVGGLLLSGGVAAVLEDIPLIIGIPVVCACIYYVGEAGIWFWSRVFRED